jgi:hypothetical protein
MPFLRVTRPKGKPISQNDSRCSTSLSQPHCQPQLFDANYPLTSKNSPPILPSIESNVLSKLFMLGCLALFPGKQLG